MVETDISYIHRMIKVTKARCNLRSPEATSRFNHVAVVAGWDVVSSDTGRASLGWRYSTRHVTVHRRIPFIGRSNRPRGTLRSTSEATKSI
jgi:hypothetical protein